MQHFCNVYVTVWKRSWAVQDKSTLVCNVAAASGCDLAPDSAVLFEPLSGKCYRGAKLCGYERNIIHRRLNALENQ